jgi:predicted peptidase
MIKPLCSAFTALLLLAGCASTPHPALGLPAKKQTAQVLATTRSKDLKVDYLLFLPEGYDEKATNRWPLILFLHGIGERGSDPWKVKVHGPPKVAESMTNFPFIVVSPQCPEGQWWSNATLEALLDSVTRKYPVDTNRVYLTGLSMGGFGAWSLALEFPERFAAVAPLCGGGNPYYPMSYNASRKAAIKALPFWVFHGDKDNSVALEESQRMVNALKKLGGDVQFTVYPGVGHDCWTQTYSNPDFYSWLLAHRR